MFSELNGTFPMDRFFRCQWLVVLLAFACLTSCATKQNHEEAELRLRLGTSLLEQGNLPNALRELLTAEKLDPKNEIVQNNLGLIYFLRNHVDLALPHLKKAIELKPQFSEGRNNYARLLIEVARYDEAIAELQIVLRDLTYDQPSKAWVNLGLAYFRKGDYGQARSKLAEGLKLERTNCLGQILYGRSALELGDFASASKTLDHAVVLCQGSNIDEAKYYSGLSYYKLGRSSSAIGRMEEVVKLYPEGQYAKKAQSLLKLMK
jgi:type IV pilus assembly protein PilF